MSGFDAFTRKVAETARSAAKKSGDLVEVTKLTMSINTEEGKIEKLYTEMGKIIYEEYKKGNFSSNSIKEICTKIEEHENIIKDMKKKINELKKIKNCTACGEEIDVNAVFCPKCGAKQEVEAPAEERTNENRCPKCGATVTEEAVFCSSCGNKLA